MANAIINTASSGDNTIIAAPANGFIRVYEYDIVFTGSTTTYFAAGADSVPLTGPYPASISVPWAEDGQFDLPNKTALILNNAAAVQVSGKVLYQVRQ
jgi:hypothetical protein